VAKSNVKNELKASDLHSVNYNKKYLRDPPVVDRFVNELTTIFFFKTLKLTSIIAGGDATTHYGDQG
jgi:hypothetical protein